MRKKEIQQASSNRLLLITNREPFQIYTRDGEDFLERAHGGLMAALEPAIQKHPALWITGVSPDIAHPEKLQTLQAKIAQLPYSWVPIQYDPQLYDAYYHGFSNRILWPLYHSMLGDMMRFLRDEWAAYKQINHQFARSLAQHARADDTLWIHDYQLSLVPGYLRAEALPPNTHIGFFLHTPFPTYDIFRTLPWAKQILEGMLGAGLIGFHIEEYCQHFFDCVEEILHIPCNRKEHRVNYQGRLVQIRAFPIGIDIGPIYDAIETPELHKRSAQLRQDLSAPYLIVGVDRLDYTKGLYKRLRALETFFEKYSERRGQVSMIQLAVPSRASIASYQTLRDEIEQLVGHINGKFGKPHWTPLTYMYRSMPTDELIALYHAADVGLVTPLRDGMNLVAKEYVAAHRKKAGVLVLSELAGAAHQLTEALLVNPYDVDGIADAIENALLMTEPVQQNAMKKLNKKIASFDIHAWMNAFLTECRNVD